MKYGCLIKIHTSLNLTQKRQEKSKYYNQHWGVRLYMFKLKRMQLDNDTD